MAANPHANGGLLLRDLKLPDFRAYGLAVPAPGVVEAQDMLELGAFVRDIVKLNVQCLTACSMVSHWGRRCLEVTSTLI